MGFQIRGSPSVHSFIWVIGAPKLTLHNADEYINWLDNMVSEYFPNFKVDFTVYELVKTYKIQRHLKACTRYKNDKIVLILVDFLLIEQ